MAVMLWGSWTKCTCPRPRCADLIAIDPRFKLLGCSGDPRNPKHPKATSIVFTLLPTGLWFYAHTSGYWGWFWPTPRRSGSRRLVRNRNHGKGPRRKAKPKPRLRQRNDWHPPCEKSDHVGMLGQVLKCIFSTGNFLKSRWGAWQLDAQEATSFCKNGSQRFGVQIYQVHNKYSSQNAQGT